MKLKSSRASRKKENNKKVLEQEYMKTVSSQLGEIRMGKWVIAHRGASALYPENTIPAFQAAVEMGAHCVEMDVQPTKDRQLVIFHDRTLERITGLPHRVTELPWKQLKIIDVGKWKGERWHGITIPRLSEVLTILPSTTKLNIELKYHDPRDDWFERAVISAVTQHDIKKRGYLAIKHVESVSRLRELDPDLPLGLLQKKRSPQETFDLCLQWEFSVVQIRKSSASPEWVDRYHDHGIKVNLFFSDDVEEMRQLYHEIGLDGILTNYPDRGLLALKQSQ